MSDELQPLEVRDASGLRLAIARARFNDKVTSGLSRGAVEYLSQSGAAFDVFDVPGAFELPLVASELVAAGYDGVVALGAVIEGETDHYEHVAGRASEGLMQVMLETKKPIGFGILMVRKEEHAVQRSQPGPANKGAEAAAAVVETAILIRQIHQS